MGTIKLILVLGVVGAVFYTGVQILPPYFANYEFQDSIETEARMGTYSVKGDDVIRDAVFKRAQELELPITKDQIKIVRTGPSGNGAVSIETDYTVHVDLPGYPLDLDFHPHSKNKSAF